MRRTRFHRWPCPIARATDLLGDWWTPLVLRNATFGQRRFDELQSSLGVPRAILARRLARLVADGVLEKERYQERPPRYEYRLTEKGRAFFDVLAALWRWGEDWAWPNGEPPVALVDRESGRPVRPVVIDEHTGKRLDARRLRAVSRRKLAKQAAKPLRAV